MLQVYQRVSEWNAARYARLYNKELALSLLREEYKEYLEATNPVDRLDALCDMAYVAMGVLWKLDVSDEDMQTAGQHSVQVISALLDINELNPVVMTSTYLDVLEYQKDYPPLVTMNFIITACFTEIHGMGVDPIAAMTIVCDSNDSKSVKRVAPHVKANIDKGENFIPPEPRLNKY